MSEEIEYIDPELNEFERQLKSRLTVKKEDEKNLNFLKEFLSQKRNQINFINIDNSIKIEINNINEPEMPKPLNKKIPIILIIIAIIAISAIYYFIQKQTETTSILKATYHIAYFEDIDIVDRLSKDLNLIENEYAKFIFYKPTNIIDSLLITKESKSNQPAYVKVEFKNLKDIYKNTINSFIADTNANKKLVILGNMPTTPLDVRRKGDKQHFISKDQFDILKKVDNLEVDFFFNSNPTYESNYLISRLNVYNLKYKINKVK